MNLPATPTTYEGQLAARVAELLPDLDTMARLELLGAMDADDMRSSLAFLVTLFPQAFDFALVRDRGLVERLAPKVTSGPPSTAAISGQGSAVHSSEGAK